MTPREPTRLPSPLLQVFRYRAQHRVQAKTVIHAHTDRLQMHAHALEAHKHTPTRCSHGRAHTGSRGTHTT